jgi:hypothetical protein
MATGAAEHHLENKRWAAWTQAVRERRKRWFLGGEAPKVMRTPFKLALSRRSYQDSDALSSGRDAERAREKAWIEAYFVGLYF